MSFAGGSAYTFDITNQVVTHSNVTLEGSGKTFLCGIALHATQAAVFDDSVTLGSDASNAIPINGTPTLATPMQFTGPGRIPYRRAPAQLSDHTYAVADGN